MEYILEVENIDFSYMDGTKALTNLSMRIPGGKKIAVIGRNGAGKTTLFLHFNGVNRPAKGDIRYKGSKINYDNKNLKLLRKNIGLVFQDPDDQLFSANVYQDVSFGPLNLGWPEEKVRMKTEEALKKTGIWELRDKPVHFMSHGEKKRAAIAGVLAMEPEVLILDEPTSGLDPYYSEEILALLDEFNAAGSTVIISSHNIDEVFAWADYVFILNEGRVAAEGVPPKLFRKTDVLYGANLIKPWVLEVYDELVAAGKTVGHKQEPRTRADIINILKNNR